MDLTRFVGNTLDSNYAENHGGGFRIANTDSGYVSNNQFIGNTADDEGGGLASLGGNHPYIYDNDFIGNSAYRGGGVHVENTNTIVTSNIIKNNQASDGGGIYAYADGDIGHNIITDNIASSCGGGIGIGGDWASPVIHENTIKNNVAYDAGGGLGCDINNEHGNPVVRKNTIIYNRANNDGGGIYFYRTESEIIKCLIANNYVNVYNGGAFSFSFTYYRPHYIDSCFVVDNGAPYESGLISQKSTWSSNEITCNNSHLYYNTYQIDREVALFELSSSYNWENNFWMLTDSATIDSIIIGGNVDFMPLETDYIPGVPREPLTVDSVRNYEDSTYSTVCDSIGTNDTLFIRIFGEDASTNLREAAVALLTSGIYPTGIAVALIETVSGTYEGMAYPVIRTNTDSIRTDDIHQRIGISSIDTIAIISPPDTFYVKVGEGAGISDGRINSNEPLFTIENVMVSEKLNISCMLPEKMNVTISLYDLTGRKIRKLHESVEYGSIEREIEVNDILNGVYIIEAKLGNRTSTEKFIKIR